MRRVHVTTVQLLFRQRKNRVRNVIHARAPCRDILPVRLQSRNGQNVTHHRRYDYTEIFLPPPPLVYYIFPQRNPIPSGAIS